MEEQRRPILVVNSPELPTKALRELRDYIVESIQMGVLVLNARTTYKVEPMPELGGVRVFGGGEAFDLSAIATLHTDEPEEPVLRAHDGDVNFTGRGGAEKREIFQRLQAFREKHGRGCLAAVAAATGRKICTDTLREILINSQSVSLDDWRLIGRALDKLEKPAAASEIST